MPIARWCHSCQHRWSPRNREVRWAKNTSSERSKSITNKSKLFAAIYVCTSVSCNIIPQSLKDNLKPIVWTSGLWLVLEVLRTSIGQCRPQGIPSSWQENTKSDTQSVFPTAAVPTILVTKDFPFPCSIKKKRGGNATPSLFLVNINSTCKHSEWLLWGEPTQLQIYFSFCLKGEQTANRRRTCRHFCSQVIFHNTSKCRCLLLQQQKWGNVARIDPGLLKLCRASQFFSSAAGNQPIWCS